MEEITYPHPWIPISSGELLKENSYVFVTIHMKGSLPKIRSSYYYKNGHFHNDNGETWEAGKEGLVAWMPQMQPYVENKCKKCAVKDQYEDKLKTSIISMLSDLGSELGEEKQDTKHLSYDDLEKAESYNNGIENCIDTIKDKINKLREE